MNAQKDKLERDLQAVAKKHGMVLQSNCAYCGHTTEVVDTKGNEVGFFFTFVTPIEDE